MPNFRQPTPYAWTRRLFAALAVHLLIIGSFSVCAQENANNTNAGNTNVNANRNANINGNTNGNGNTNRNTNTNTNTNTGQNVNGNDNRAQPNDQESAALGPEARRAKLVESGWYYFLITVLFGALLIPFAMVIVRAIRFSKATFSSPLGLPEGSLRAILAYTLVSFLGFYVYASVMSFSDFKPPEFLIGIVATVIGFYFGSRTGNDSAAGARRSSAIVVVTVKDPSDALAQGATVELTLADGTKSSKSTGADGKCRFENVPAGSHTLQATQAGHSPSDPKKVQLAVGETEEVDLKLK